MATYPFKIAGAGSTTDRNVLKAKWSYPLSSKPYMKCYDNNSTFPNTGALETATYVIFTGSVANGNKPMLAFCDTSRNGPSATNWYALATINATGTYIALMKGNTSYLNFICSTLSANGSVTWNVQMRVPYDVNPTMTRLHDVCFIYSFVSTIPEITFYGNNKHEGGTESVPVWGTISASSPYSNGIRIGSAAATNTSILATIPLSGFVKTQTLWVCQS